MNWVAMARYGNLTLVACDGKKWILVCDCGEWVEKWPSNVRAGRTTSCGKHGHGTGRRPPGVPFTYHGTHARISRLRGRAECQTCPCGEPAKEWAYQHHCPDEVEGRDSNGTAILKYCPHEDHYEAMCKKCHSKLDASMRAGIPATQNV